MKTNVLIVGGGLSGLALADRLFRSGGDVLLAEAQGRLGGRILTEEIAGGRFDLGPAWFWPGQPRMAELAARFSLPVFEQYSAGDILFQDRSGATQRGRGMASMAGSLRLGGGMGAMVGVLAGEIDPALVLLDAPIRALRCAADGIVATLDRPEGVTEIHAHHVVLALPPRLVAGIAFDPVLEPAQVSALARIPTWMAGQAKILAVYDRPHWRNAGLSGDAMSHRGPMVEIHDASPAEGGPHALFGFVGVPAEARAAHADAMKDLALAQLVAMFGGEMAGALEVRLQDWATVPWVAAPEDRAALRAHPSYGLPAGLDDLWDGRVHLASTETAREFGGFLEGALEAADRVALKLEGLRVSQAARAVP